MLKNIEGERARKVAAASGHKSTAAACRRAERTRRSTADQLWAVKLYDFCTEHQSTLRDLMVLLDREDTGTVPTNVFLQVRSLSHRHNNAFHKFYPTYLQP